MIIVNKYIDVITKYPKYLLCFIISSIILIKPKIRVNGAQITPKDINPSKYGNRLIITMKNNGRITIKKRINLYVIKASWSVILSFIKSIINSLDSFNKSFFSQYSPNNNSCISISKHWHKGIINELSGKLMPVSLS